eukprot:SM000024S07792  [mRNA]  locus=s24:523657:524473:+ [translate_table: standard]
MNAGMEPARAHESGTHKLSDLLSSKTGPDGFSVPHEGTAPVYTASPGADQSGMVEALNAPRHKQSMAEHEALGLTSAGSDGVGGDLDDNTPGVAGDREARAAHAAGGVGAAVHSVGEKITHLAQDLKAKVTGHHGQAHAQDSHTAAASK